LFPPGASYISKHHVATCYLLTEKIVEFEIGTGDNDDTDPELVSSSDDEKKLKLPAGLAPAGKGCIRNGEY